MTVMLFGIKALLTQNCTRTALSARIVCRNLFQALLNSNVCFVDLLEGIVGMLLTDTGAYQDQMQMLRNHRMKRPKV